MGFPIILLQNLKFKDLQSVGFLRQDFYSSWLVKASLQYSWLSKSRLSQQMIKQLCEIKILKRGVALNGNDLPVRSALILLFQDNLLTFVMHHIRYVMLDIY